MAVLFLLGKFSCTLEEIYQGEIQITIRLMMRTLMRQMAKTEGITVELKRRDQVAWIGAMNSIRPCVRESVNRGWIFVS